MDKNIILEKLRKGTSADDIAQELVDMLNDAKDEYDAEVAKAEEAKAANSKKIEDLNFILNLIEEFIANYYCESEEDFKTLEEVFDDIDAEELIASIEEMGEMVIKLDNVFNSIFDVPVEKEKSHACNCHKAAPTVVKVNPDVVINRFLKNLGL